MLLSVDKVAKANGIVLALPLAIGVTITGHILLSAPCFTKTKI